MSRQSLWRGWLAAWPIWGVVWPIEVGVVLRGQGLSPLTHDGAVTAAWSLVLGMGWWLVASLGTRNPRVGALLAPLPYAAALGWWELSGLGVPRAVGAGVLVAGWAGWWLWSRRAKRQPWIGRLGAAALVLEGVLIVGAMGSQLTSQPRGTSLQSALPNLILVVIDTCRADLLGGYGEEHPLTPVLDRLMREGTSWTSARTPMALTGPAMVTLLTGRSPADHGLTRNGMAYRGGVPELVATLSQRGYRCGAVMSGFPLRQQMVGLGPGFDAYMDWVNGSPWLPNAVGDLTWLRVMARLRWFPLGNLLERKAAVTAEEALRLVERWRAEPFFLVVHFYDLHTPYEPRREDRLRAELPEGTPSSFVPFAEDRNWAGEPSRVEGIRELYRAELPEVDRAIGRLMAGLQRLGLSERTHLLVTADHGESFGESFNQGDGNEREWFDHGRLLNEPSLRVPFVLWGPGVAAGSLREEPVSLQQVAGIMVGLASGKVPQEVDGNTALTDHYVSPQKAAAGSEVPAALVRGVTKSVVGASGITLHYQLAEDPEERVPLRGLVEGLGAAEKQLFERRSRVTKSEAPAVLSPEQEAQMRSLGYVGQSRK